MGRREAKGSELDDGWDEENEEEMESRDTPEGGKGKRDVVGYNLLEFIVSRHSCGSYNAFYVSLRVLPFM